MRLDFINQRLKDGRGIRSNQMSKGPEIAKAQSLIMSS